VPLQHFNVKCHSNFRIYNTVTDAFADLKSESADWCGLKIWGSAHLRQTAAHATTSLEAEVKNCMNLSGHLLCRHSVGSDGQAPAADSEDKHVRTDVSVARSEHSYAIVSNAVYCSTSVIWPLAETTFSKAWKCPTYLHVYFNFAPEQASKVHLHMIHECAL